MLSVSRLSVAIARSLGTRSPTVALVSARTVMSAMVGTEEAVEVAEDAKVDMAMVVVMVVKVVGTMVMVVVVVEGLEDPPAVVKVVVVIVLEAPSAIIVSRKATLHAIVRQRLREIAGQAETHRGSHTPRDLFLFRATTWDLQAMISERF